MEDRHRGLLLVLVGPTASGKTTLLHEMLDKAQEVTRMVTATTRPPREGEEHGRDYYFLDREAFERKIEEGWFLEHEIVHGNYYGTPLEEIEKAVSGDSVVVKDIDVHGAMSLKKAYPENTVAVIILPPTPEVLEKRLRDRGTEDEEEIARRLKTCALELEFLDKNWARFDYWVTNDRLEDALDDLKAVIRAEKNRTSKRKRLEQWTIGSLNN